MWFPHGLRHCGVYQEYDLNPPGDKVEVEEHDLDQFEDKVTQMSYSTQRTASRRQCFCSSPPSSWTPSAPPGPIQIKRIIRYHVSRLMFNWRSMSDSDVRAEHPATTNSRTCLVSPDHFIKYQFFNIAISTWSSWNSIHWLDNKSFIIEQPEDGLHVSQFSVINNLLIYSKPLFLTSTDTTPSTIRTLTLVQLLKDYLLHSAKYPD